MQIPEIPVQRKFVSANASRVPRHKPAKTVASTVLMLKYKFYHAR